MSIQTRLKKLEGPIGETPESIEFIFLVPMKAKGASPDGAESLAAYYTGAPPYAGFTMSKPGETSDEVRKRLRESYPANLKGDLQ